MKYLVITEKDSMLLTADELRQIVVSGKVHKHNARVFGINNEEQSLRCINVFAWENGIPWVDLVDIYGNLITTLKPNEKGE